MTPIHPNYAKAAKLMMVSFGISCISLIQILWSLFSMDVALANTGLASHSDGFKSIAMITIIITTAYFLIMAHLIRQGLPLDEISFIRLFSVDDIQFIDFWLW